MKFTPALNNAIEHTGKLFASPLARYGLLFGVVLVITGMAIGTADSPVPASSPEVIVSLDLGNGTDEPKSDTPPPVQAAEPQPEELKWQDVTVASGETLDAIFRKRGYSIGLLHEIINMGPETKKLARIHPGQLIQFVSKPDGSLERMRFNIDETLRLSVINFESGLELEHENRNIQRRHQMVSGTIDDNLFLAGNRAGLSDNMIMKLASIFGWDIDFVLDIRKDDQFHAIYEQIYRDGEYLRDGEILAATFINQGERFRALRFTTDDGDSFYTPEGMSMRKTFLRAPLNFSYISSSFSPKRFHPILKRVKAHNGIDYRAPKGTPVYAAGDGKVIRSTHSQYNGHHVFIQHGNNIVTKYLHFTNRTVKNGQRVKQGQVIGYVGATGLAQAPHLHYEFVVNGVHRNPRTVRLSKADPLPEQIMSEYKVRTKPLLDQLEIMEGPQMFAASGQ